MKRPLGSSLATSAGIQALNVLTGVLLARALGPHGRGELAAVLLWPAVLAAVGSLGVSEAATYHTARRTAAVGTLVGSGLMLSFLQSAVLVTVGALVVPIVFSHYGSAAIGAAQLFLAFIPLNLLALYLIGVLNGLHRFGWAQGLRLMVVASQAAGFLSLTVAGALTVRGAVLVSLASTLATALVAALLVLRVGVRPLGCSRALVRQLLGFGVKSHLGNVSSLLNERLDQLVISIFLAPAKLGLYVIAVTLTSVTALVGASVSFVALPTVAALPEGRARAAARRLIAFTLAASAVVTVPVILFTGPLIELFFGPAFAGATDVARVLLVAAVVLSTTRTVTAVLKAINRPLSAGLAESLALGVTFVGLAALLPTLGLLGAGLASLLAYCTSAAWSVRQAARALDLSPTRLLLPERLTPTPAEGG